MIALVKLALLDLQADFEWAEEYCKKYPYYKPWMLDRLNRGKTKFARSIESLQDVNTLIAALEESDSKKIQE
jgi:hypothetical protein